MDVISPRLLTCTLSGQKKEVNSKEPQISNRAHVTYQMIKPDLMRSVYRTTKSGISWDTIRDHQ